VENDNQKDIELNIYDANELNAILKEYISNDSCNVIFTVSEKNLEMAKEDEEFNECLLKADLLLSSTDFKNEESSEGNEAGVDVEIINKIASDEEVDALSMMLLTDDSEFAEIYDAKMEEVFADNEYAEYVGSHVISEDMDDDLFINEINARLPDVLVCVCESPVQEKWIMQNKSKLSVKIVLALTGEKEEFLQKKDTGINFLAKIFGRR
jgi:N-acetylglucosaminyldiphosphoundecaprenol N-acetyl-beta-D-mannosaminyltransferase